MTSDCGFHDSTVKLDIVSANDVRTLIQMGKCGKSELCRHTELHRAIIRDAMNTRRSVGDEHSIRNSRVNDERKSRDWFSFIIRQFRRQLNNVRLVWVIGRQAILKESGRFRVKEEDHQFFPFLASSSFTAWSNLLAGISARLPTRRYLQNFSLSAPTASAKSIISSS